jgi:hypothetical protein
MTRTELVEMQQAYSRALQGRTTPIYIAPLLGLVGRGGHFDGVDVSRWGYWPEALAFAALVALLATVTIVFPRLKDRQVRKFGLACPSCGEPLLDMTGRIAAVTGRCGTCGHQVLDPEDSSRKSV